MKNPYSLTFGKEPIQMISRPIQKEEIIENFNDDNPSQQIYMIVGVRGSGKTVFMTEISKELKFLDDWIIINLNPDTDLLEGLASKLSSESTLANMFKDAKINLSFFGFGAEINVGSPIYNIEIAIERMLENIKKHNKKVLVTIDEVTNTENMRIFASSFQILIRQDLPLFLIMTGLYGNIDNLQNVDNLTFLYRAPKMELKPLNIGSIADNYENNLNISKEQALDMAKATRGYSFAFQVMGYYAWETNNDTTRLKALFKQHLDEYVYEKIWSELSKQDKDILYAIAKTPDGKISSIRNKLDIDNNHFNPYRKRLIKKGLIDGSQYGYVTFKLPLFEEFVVENYG